MLKSMTGYGDATVETDKFVLSLEVKSVNNRFLKIAGKVSEEASFVHNSIEDVIRRRLHRGSVYFMLRFELKQFGDLYDIDQTVLKKYRDSLQSICDGFGEQGSVRLRDLLTLPGVTVIRESALPERDRIIAGAKEATDAALDKLVAMRETEGANLEADFRQRCKLLGELLTEINGRLPAVLDGQQEKLRSRVNQLLAESDVSVNSEDVLKEVAILTERSDMAEEIARMESHLQQFEETMAEERPVGRKLEFIVQEMLRESNTMGSKSSCSELSRNIVLLKTEVDRLKEQVSNVE